MKEERGERDERRKGGGEVGDVNKTIAIQVELRIKKNRDSHIVSSPLLYKVLFFIE